MKDEDYTGSDKALHMFCSFLMALYSTEGAIFADVAKEYGDYKNPNSHWCWWDLAWDISGVIIGTAVRYYVISRWNWF